MNTIADVATLAGASITSAEKAATSSPKGGAKKASAKAKPLAVEAPAPGAKQPRTGAERATKASSTSAKHKTTASAASVTKAETILKLLRRKKGATIEEMQQATGWQAHSVRGFLSAGVKKRLGIDLKSEQGSDGVRRYVVPAG